MFLFINNPIFYTRRLGIENEIYLFCRKISRFISGKYYNNYTKTMEIIPIIAPEEIFFEEEIFISEENDISISLKINFEKYLFADMELKKKLITKNIIESGEIIRNHIEFNSQKFKTDILECTGYLDKELDEIY